MVLFPSSLRTVAKARKTARPRQSANRRESVMKRFHVHVAVDDLKQSIGFYSALFAAEPSVIKTDYAKWMLDDPFRRAGGSPASTISASRPKAATN